MVVYNSTPMKVDIIIPLYNEESALEKSVGTLTDFLDHNGFPHEYRVVLADNGSTDRSAEICRKLATMDARVRHMEIGAKGKGLAIRKAWERSEADIVAFMDVDLASDLAYFVPLVSEVSSGHYDLSVGNRLGRESQVISRKRFRKVASRVYNTIVRALFGSRLDDHQCGFKAMRKEAFDMIAGILEEDGFTFDTELIVRSMENGLRISSVDIVWRDSDTSKVSLWHDSSRMFSDLFRLKNRLSKRS